MMKKIALVFLLSFAWIGFAAAADTDFTQQNIEMDGNWGPADC